MAVLRFDPRGLNIDVVVGVNETYTPTKEIKSVHRKIVNLKKKTNKFIADTWQDKEMDELGQLFSEDKEELVKWEAFLKKTYNPKVQEILTTIDSINKRICPNYEDIKIP